MALGAGNIGTQECGQQIRYAIERHLGVPQEETGGSVLIEFPVGRHHVAHHHIPRDVHGDLFLEPILVEVGLGTFAIVILHPQHVGQPVVHVHGVAGGVQQRVDELHPLVRGTVAEVCLRLRCGGNAPDGVEIKPPEQLCLGGRGTGRHAILRERSVDGFVQLRRGPCDHILGHRLAGLGPLAGHCELLVGRVQPRHREAPFPAVLPFHRKDSVFKGPECRIELHPVRGRPGIRLLCGSGRGIRCDGLFPATLAAFLGSLRRR